MRATAGSLPILLLALAACTPTPPPPPPPPPPSAPPPPADLPPPHFTAEPWPIADALFQQDPRWLGGDAVYSVDLHDDRILWLFGDSFVAKGERRDRRDAVMVRNSIAIQHGRDPRTARLQFHWRTTTTAPNTPTAFFPDRGPEGYWPLHGIRLVEGPLLLWQTRVRNTPGEGLGFAIDGWRILRIDEPDGDPARWRWREVAIAGPPTQATLGTAVWRDGPFVVTLGTLGHGPHRGVLARFAVDSLRRDAAEPQWWNGSAWTTSPPLDQPHVVLPDAGPECSLHRHGDRWLHAYSRGFGRTTVAVHTAPSPTGPWSPPIDVFTPPESLAARPFVYAAKAHPGVDAGGGWLAVSYAANAFDFAALFTDDGQRALYWPRFFRVRMR